MKAIKTLVLAAGLIFGASAWAVPVTINYTSDNTTLIGGICAETDCDPFNIAIVLADDTAPNAGNWRNADSAVIDLGPGTYGIAFAAQNTGTGSNRNPAGFLAEILWAGGHNVTSSGWDVTTDGLTWVGATEWAQNGTGIWGGHLLGEISSDAQWIWTANNFDSSTDEIAGFRTTITISAVPEPGSLALLGIGLLGFGLARRRK